jgi:hypothetical protein
MTIKTRVYALRSHSGEIALVRAVSPAAAIRHWADSMLDVVRSATQDDIIDGMSKGAAIEVAGEIEREGAVA